MSLPGKKVYCTGCSFTQYIHPQPIRLRCRLDNAVATYLTKIAWCPTCKAIVRAEYVPSIQEIQHEIEQVRAKAKDEFEALDETSEFDIQLLWRQKRTAPPHCLYCGSTELHDLDFRESSAIKITEHRFSAKDFKHDCGGSFVYAADENSDLRIAWVPQVYWMDLNGRVINDESEAAFLQIRLMDWRYLGRVCPRQDKWQRLWVNLPNKDRKGKEISPLPPPSPEEWESIPDIEKRARFLEHIRWAELHGWSEKLFSILDHLHEEQWHHVWKPNTVQNSTTGG